MLEVIKSRRSIRAFQKKVPPPEVIRQCLEAATWAPSATNQQPWEFVVATGAELEKIISIIQENFAERMQGKDLFNNLPEPCRKRQEEIFATLMQVAKEEGINPKDMFQKGLSFFDAPVGVYFITYKRNDDQHCLSTAAALENFLLAARSQGLGTCWLTITVICQEDIKKHLGISDDKVLLGGVAVGYPLEDSRFNTFTRTRVPVDDITTWLGF